MWNIVVREVAFRLVNRTSISAALEDVAEDANYSKYEEHAGEILGDQERKYA